MTADVHHQNYMSSGPINNNFNNAAKMAMLQQSLRHRMPAGPIYTNVGLTPEELLAAKKPFTRKSVDYNASMINKIENRIWQRDYRDRHLMQPDPGYIPLMTPSMDYLENPSNAVTTKFVRTAMNKMKCPVFSITWTPNGRRLLTGSSSGEFTLWNGLQFNFETILQAHDAPIRAMTWSNTGMWLLSGDHNGFIKYWQTNMNNVKMYQAHREVIRDICFSPTDNKFASCSDDATVRIWDFFSGVEERVLRGHGADCKTVHWHPTMGLLVSGSKDAQQPIKLWDPKTGKSLNTLFPHKAAVTCCRFSPNGYWMVSTSRDHMIKLFDIRNMKNELNTMRGHKREVICVDWHPFYSQMLVSGGGDGSILYWDIGLDKQVGGIDNAHEGIIWDIKWHPLGHITASASNDFSTKFWTRNNPGDKMKDKYNLNIDEELETEELVANQETEAQSELAHLQEDVPYSEYDTSVPALNPEETAKVPKERRKRYMPPQFSTDTLGFGEGKMKRGDKRIDPRFKIMWSSYQRPDLLREEMEDRNVPTYDGEFRDMQFFDPKPPFDSGPPPVQNMPPVSAPSSQPGFSNPLAGHRAPPPWEVSGNGPAMGMHKNRPTSENGPRPMSSGFNDYGAPYREQSNMPPNPRHRPPRPDPNFNRYPPPNHSNGMKPPHQPPQFDDVNPDNMQYRDMDFRHANRTHPPPGPVDVDFRNSNYNQGPPPNRMHRPPPPHDNFNDSVRPPPQRMPNRPPGVRPGGMMGTGPPPRGSFPRPRGPSGRGGLNWYS